MFDLFPYQEQGARWLSHGSHHFLADEMGLGKTVQAIIAALQHLTASRVLIVCPAIARVNWEREVRKVYDWRVPLIVLEQLDQRPPAAAAPKVFICSYEYARANREYLTSSPEPWDVTIMDEAQHVLRISAKRTQAIFGTNPKGIARHTKRVWWLSGTPIENHVGDLWLPFFFSGRTRLGRMEWLERYCTLDDSSYANPDHPKVNGLRPENLQELRDLIQQPDFFLRRTKLQVGHELPPLHHTTWIVEDALSTPQEAAQELSLSIEEMIGKVELERRLIVQAIGEDARVITEQDFAILQGLARSVSTLRRYTGVRKAGASATLICEELTEDPCRKEVVFFEHLDGGLVASRIFENNGIGFKLIHGNTSPKKRQEAIDAFQEDPDCRVMLAQIRCASTAINLTSAHHVTLIETPWTPSIAEQAIARCHRWGQTQPVLARSMVLQGDLLDQAIGEYVARKSRAIQTVLAPPTLAEELCG